MRVQVEYSVSVFAEVDLETGSLERVVVDDESISGPDRRSVCDAAAGQRVDPERAARAVKIAERGEWPAWVVGF